MNFHLEELNKTLNYAIPGEYLFENVDLAAAGSPLQDLRRNKQRKTVAPPKPAVNLQPVKIDTPKDSPTAPAEAEKVPAVTTGELKEVVKSFN